MSQDDGPHMAQGSHMGARLAMGPYGVNAPSHMGPHMERHMSGGGVMSLETFLRGEASPYGAVTPERAMRVSTVWRCVSLISEAIARLPVEVFERRGAIVRRAEDHPIEALFFDGPNDVQTPFEFLRLMISWKLLRGNAYAQIIRLKGRVIGLLPLDPHHVEIKRAGAGLRYHLRREDGSSREFPQRDILHIRGISHDGIEGLSIIGAARKAISVALEAEGHSEKSLREGLSPAAVYTHPQILGEEGRENLSQSFKQFRGADGHAKALILEEGMRFDQLTMSHADAQFIETRAFQKADIAAFFGVPLHYINQSDGAALKDLGALSKQFVSGVLGPHLVGFAQALRKACAPGERIEIRFNADALSLIDLEARAKYVSTLTQFGILSPNEARAMEGLNPRPGGDVFYPPPNQNGTENGAENSGRNGVQDDEA